jgi:alpha-glucosidase (family GH31 glycosyl hydrolase)
MINDPHIQASDNYFVYYNGMVMQNATQPQGNFTNIFIRDPSATEPFYGKCWPGVSVWMDYLNTNAADYWKSLYLRKNFKGTNYLYGTWNDMNEPSVFADKDEIDQLGMPMNNTHIMTDGFIV